MIAAEQRTELLAALATLRDDDREVLGARFLLDLSEAETAETLGIPRGTVKSRTSRALARLREALAATSGLDAMTDRPLAGPSTTPPWRTPCVRWRRPIDWPTAAPVAPSGATAGPDIATRVRVRLDRPASAPGPTRPWWRPSTRPVRRSLVLAIVALLALAIVAGAVGLGLPGLRFILGEPPASVLPSPTPVASATPSDRPTPPLPAITGMPARPRAAGRARRGRAADRRSGRGCRRTRGWVRPTPSWVDSGKFDQIAYVWAADEDLPETSERGVGLVLMRFAGRSDDEFYQKVIGSGTRSR